MDLLKAREFFFNLHDVEVNQKYGDKPYSFHLNEVYDLTERSLHYIKGPTEDSTTTLRQIALCVALGHDSIEDARLSYNDITHEFGGIVAEHIFTLTEYRGRNRDERHPDVYYRDIFNNQITTLVKLADYIANLMAKIIDNNANAVKQSVYEFENKYLPNMSKSTKLAFNDLIETIQALQKVKND